MIPIQVNAKPGSVFYNSFVLIQQNGVTSVYNYGKS